VGQTSEPVPVLTDTSGKGQYAVFMVSETESDRELDENVLGVLKARAFYNWLSQDHPKHNERYEFNTDQQMWVEARQAKYPELNR
jgi:hypothetical protein